ncbi:MAG: DNA mismatch repair protein MutS [Deltaproteobacteria bacterium]|nr:DNA mismatch repair protein MutS [Deltaproteobacteria bacterium]
MATQKTRESACQSGFYLPFQQLGEKIAQIRRCLSSKPSPPRLPAQGEDAALFAEAMREVVPLDLQGAYSVPWKTRRFAQVPPEPEDWEVLCHLMELVEGKGEFDLSLTDEYVEGQVPGLDPQVVAALKAGALPLQDYCDLHGLSVPHAQVCLRQFLAQALVRDYRTVLVVHGRGHNSPDNLPVLKGHLQRWLTMKRFRRQVLAFASAQPYDGGTGALYLLLRRGRPHCKKKGL